MSVNTIIMAVAENTVTKVINRFGKKATYHNGGYRAGFIINGEEFAAINKFASYSGEADCWAVLKAVEYAIGQGWKGLNIVGHHATPSKRGKDKFFLQLAQSKSDVAGMTLEFSDDSNEAARCVARSSGAAWLPFAPAESPEVKAHVAAALKAIQTDNGTINPMAMRGNAPAPMDAPESVIVEADLVEAN